MRRPWRGVPLRAQLLVLLLTVTAMVVLVTGLAGTAVLRRSLVDRVDSQLREAVAAPAIGQFGRRRPARDLAVTVLRYDSSGALVVSDDPREGRARPAEDTGPVIRDVTALPPGPSTVPGHGGSTQWRVLAVDARRGGTLVVGAPLVGVQQTVASLLRIEAAIGLLALFGAGLLAWAAVRRSLAPLVAVEHTAEAIAAGDLTRRVPAADPRTEVGSLAASFNTMVDRFESAYSEQRRSQEQARASESRMRQFVGDASHELRTPLTSIRGFAELYRQGAAEDPVQLARVLRRIEDESTRMGGLVDDLLLLARLDAQRPLDRTRVDLLALAADAVHDAAAVAGRAHDVVLASAAGGPSPEVLGDGQRLRQVLANLVANAVAHTPAGTRVEVSVGREDAWVVLAVADDGPGMEPEVAARVFERFYRADAARARSDERAGGSGLGLSIVAALVQAHGGSVHVDSQQGAGTCFTVRLPAA